MEVVTVLILEFHFAAVTKVGLDHYVEMSYHHLSHGHVVICHLFIPMFVIVMVSFQPLVLLLMFVFVGKDFGESVVNMKEVHSCVTENILGIMKYVEAMVNVQNKTIVNVMKDGMVIIVIVKEIL